MKRYHSHHHVASNKPEQIKAGTAVFVNPQENFVLEHTKFDADQR